MIELIKSPVFFDEEKHEYWLGDKQLQGVTGTLVHRANPDKYNGVSAERLAQAAEKGHDLHSQIEFHDNFGTSIDEHDDPRIASYENIKLQYGLTTVANEYLVSDEERYASCIDIVMMNINGEICLVDIKTTYELDRLSTAIQLSIYKRFFERQNPGMEISHIYVLWMPNKDLTIAELIELSLINDKALDALFEADINDEPFDTNLLYGPLPAKLASVEDEIIKIDAQMNEWKDKQEKLKKGLYELMVQHDIKSFKGGRITLTRVLPTTSETFDSKKFKEDDPDTYAKYVKSSKRAGSLKITISSNV